MNIKEKSDNLTMWLRFIIRKFKSLINNIWPFKKVKCKNCGYLTEKTGFVYECYRNSSVEIKLLNNERDCKFFLKKIEGLTPEQHLEHQLYKAPGVTTSWLALALSTIAMCITIYTANNPPTILGIERFDYYDTETSRLEELNRKLSNGKHTILYTRDLNINAPGYGDKHIIVLGKIKK